MSSRRLGGRAATLRWDSRFASILGEALGSSPVIRCISVIPLVSQVAIRIMRRGLRCYKNCQIAPALLRLLNQVSLLLNPAGCLGSRGLGVSLAGSWCPSPSLQLRALCQEEERQRALEPYLLHIIIQCVPHGVTSHSFVPCSRSSSTDGESAHPAWGILSPRLRSLRSQSERYLRIAVSFPLVPRSYSVVSR